jgi:hypothetical membrane protein
MMKNMENQRTKDNNFRESFNEKMQKLRDGVNKTRKGFFDAMTDYRFVKICTLLVVPGFLGLVIIGHIIASLYGPYGYTIWTRMISDLGGSKYTPAPYLYDAACVIAGSLTIPVNFYLEKLLIPMPQTPGDYNKYSRLRYRIGSYAFLCSIIGSVGYILVGVFSEDRSPNLFGLMGAHSLASTLAFAGFTFAAFFLGWIIILYNVKIPKILGIYAIFGPIAALILFAAIPTALWEWMLLFSILIWIIPLSFIIMNNEELQIEPTIEKSILQKNIGLTLIGYVALSYIITFMVNTIWPIDITLLVNMVVISPIILVLGISLFIKGKN